MQKRSIKMVRIATAGELRRQQERAAKADRRANAAFEFIKGVGLVLAVMAISLVLAFTSIDHI